MVGLYLNPPHKALVLCLDENPKPFIWTATVSHIIEKIERARLKMGHIKPGSTLPRGKKTVTFV